MFGSLKAVTLGAFKKALARLCNNHPPRLIVTPRRTRLELEHLGDRIVPANLTIEKLSDGTEGGSDGSFRVTRDGSTANSLIFVVSTSGTATSGTDYTAPSISYTIAAGKSSADFSIVVTNDGTAEPTETVVAKVAEYAIPVPTNWVYASLEIFDNESPQVVVETLNDAIEGGAAGAFRFTRLGDLSGAITVNYSVGTGSGAATPGTDYTALGTSVSIGSGKATATVSVAAAHDGVSDPDETVTVTVGTGTGYSVGSPSSATVDIVDFDLLPEAFGDWVATSVNESVDVEVFDLATDLNEDELEVTAVTQGSDGSVTINLDGSVTYTPDTGFVGDDSFTYTVEDDFGNEATATISVTVTEPLAPPTSLWTAKNASVNVDAAEMAFDPDEDELEVISVTQGGDGSVVIETDGTITYTPNTNFTGEDSFDYTVEDPDGNEATNTITVTVGPTDPVALDDEAETPVDTAVNVEVLDLAFQPAGGSLTVIDVTQGDHGTVVIELDGTVTYTPDTSFTGTDTFTYTVQDGSSRTGIGTITVTVGTPINPADEIIDDVEDLEAEIEDYDVNNPLDLSSLASAITSAVSGHVANVTSFIDATNVGENGVRDIAIDVYRKMLIQTNSLQALHGALDSMLVASKALIENLGVQLRAAVAAGNRAQVDNLLIQLPVALQAHDHAQNAMTKTKLTWVLAHQEAVVQYRTLQRAYGTSPKVLNLSAPTLPAFFSPDRYTPKP